MGGSLNLPQERTNDGDPGQKKRLQIRANDADANLQIHDFNPAGTTFADAGDKAALTLQPREILVPDSLTAPANYKRIQVLASAAYHSNLAFPTGLPSGVNAGDIVFYNGSAWVRSDVGTPSSGDFLKWDGSKYVKVTPATVDVITSLSYSTSTHKLTYGKKTLTLIAAGSETTGNDFTNNDFVPES